MVGISRVICVAKREFGLIIASFEHVNFGSNPFLAWGGPNKNRVIETCFSGNSDVIRATISDPGLQSRTTALFQRALEITAQPAAQDSND